MTYLIDEDVLRFLNGHLGGNDADAFIRCSDFAYRDMCRTIRFKKEYNEGSASTAKERAEITRRKKALREEVTKELTKQVKKCLATPPSNFESDHTALCNKIIEIYQGTTDQGEQTESLYFGQAQKWVNMTLKNLYVYSKSNEQTGICLDVLLPHLHIPIDNVILDVASDKVKCYVDKENTEYHVKKPQKPWSKWSKEDYENYRAKLKDALGDQTPLLWELTHWSTVTHKA